MKTVAPSPRERCALCVRVGTVCMCVYVCTYVCMYVGYMYVCMHGVQEKKK